MISIIPLKGPLKFVPETCLINLPVNSCNHVITLRINYDEMLMVCCIL